jgi:hypothetical protein
VQTVPKVGQTPGTLAVVATLLIRMDDSGGAKQGHSGLSVAQDSRLLFRPPRLLWTGTSGEQASLILECLD